MVDTPQSSPPQTYTARLLVPHPDERRILTDLEGATPTITVPVPPTDSWWRETAVVNRAVREQMGLHATVLYCAAFDDTPGERTATYALEVQDPQWEPAGNLMWAAFDDAATVAWDKYAKLGDSNTWSRPGWFGEASQWLEEKVGERGWSLVGEVEQVRSWFLSSILRAETTGGVVYLKAALPMYRYEPALTERLSWSYPSLLPEVLAIDNERRWLLMREVKGVKLRLHPNREQYLPRWEGVLRDYARIQLDYTTQVQELFDVGLPDLRLESIAARIEPFFMALPQLFDRSELAPDAVAMARYESWVPRLLEICAQLREYDLPPTLHHGDLHSGNILANDRDCKLLDWAGFIGVSHPFCFLSTVFEEHTDPQVQDRLLRAYLEPWQLYGSMERLMEAVKLAVRLGWVCGLFGHAAQVQLAADPWEVKQEQGNIAYCLRSLEQILS